MSQNPLWLVDLGCHALDVKKKQARKESNEA